MILTLDIQKKAAPIIRQTHKVTLWSTSDASQRISEDINDLILTIEGFDNHVFSLNKVQAKALLDETNKVIAVFVDIDDALTSVSGIGSEEIIEKFKYALKALFKLKSLLHLAYTKDVSVKQTSRDVREGLSAASRAAVLHNFSKHTH
jgi:hypothetical protein